MLEEKILSIPEHITNQHTFPNNDQHKQCSHSIPIEGDRDKKWLRPDSMVGFFCIIIFEICNSLLKAVKKVRDALLGHDKCRVRELQHMLGFTHTGLIGRTCYISNMISFRFSPESWNALNNKYANKHFYYGYTSMTIS